MRSISVVQKWYYFPLFPMNCNRLTDLYLVLKQMAMALEDTWMGNNADKSMAIYDLSVGRITCLELLFLSISQIVSKSKLFLITLLPPFNSTVFGPLKKRETYQFMSFIQLLRCFSANIIKFFKVSEIVPYNNNIFTDTDFAAITVTNLGWCPYDVI